MSAGALPALERILALGESEDLGALLGARIEQVERHGHDHAGDDERRICELGSVMVQIAMLARDLTYAGDRQDLPRAYRRTAQVGALAIAVMRRIRREQELQS